MRNPLLPVLTGGLFFSSILLWGQNSPCDLTADGKVDASDVQAAINMSLGASPCTANVIGTNVCNVVVVQRVINASLGGACVTSAGHNALVNWTASTSSNVTGYKVYRSTTTGGPYTFLASAGSATSCTDTNVQPGTTYFYVITALDSANNESIYSSQAQAAIATP